LEFSTVEESEQGSSATDSLSEDVTDGWNGSATDSDGRTEERMSGRMKKEEGRRKKEGSFLKLAMPNAFRPNYQFPMTINQFPKTNRARTARPIYN
jgi:hypothetical protein